MNSINKLQGLIYDIENYIPHATTTKAEVSKANVAWHLDHSLKVIIGISKQLLVSEPSNYKSNFNLSRSILFTLGFIPRGKGKAPKVVLPPETILTDDIRSQVETAKDLILKLNDLPKDSNFKHAVFGLLNKSQTIRFLEVHTKHHLKIVADILK